MQLLLSRQRIRVDLRSLVIRTASACRSWTASSATAQLVRRGKLGAIERGHILTRQNQCNWTVPRLQRDAPSDGRLIGIARTNDRETWNRTQAGELLHRLYGVGPSCPKAMLSWVKT